MDPVIHQPTRLRIMGLLFKHRDIGFTATRDTLGLSDGNLATHARRLEEAGYLDARRVLHKTGFELRYRLTPKGAVAFRGYLQELQAFIDGAEP